MTDSELVAQFLKTQGVTKVAPAPYKSNRELAKTGAESFFERIAGARQQLDRHGPLCNCSKCWSAATLLRTYRAEQDSEREAEMARENNGFYKS